MYCLKCGKKVPDDSDFCIYCGQRLSGDFTNSAVNSVPEYSIQPTYIAGGELKNETTQKQDNQYPWNGRLSRKKYLIATLCFGIPYTASFFLSEDIGLIVGVIFLIAWTIAAIKRCHDFDQSGWLCLLLLIPIIGLCFGIYLLFRKSTPWTNRYGPIES